MMRGTKALGLKAIADEALKSNPQVGKVVDTGCRWCTCGDGMQYSTRIATVTGLIGKSR
jgi:hypothetical protein